MKFFMKLKKKKKKKCAINKKILMFKIKIKTR